LRKGALLGVSLLAMVPGVVFAQDNPAPAPADPGAGPDAGIVVTGSRIRVPNATSVSPITTVGAADLAQRGVTRLEDMLNTLPQVYADQGGGNRGGTVGASGTATINLRNLGNQRTLVLINGRRLMQGDPARSAAQAADINNVPAALVERIDVVTGGASAVYGSTRWPVSSTSCSRRTSRASSSTRATASTSTTTAIRSPQSPPPPGSTRRRAAPSTASSRASR
jgi:outer membrane cobalamin receptor